MNFGKLIDLTADRLPNKTAVIQGERRISYSEWNHSINRLANALADRGLNQGSFFIICMKNRIEFFTVFFAVQKLGVVPVPISPKTTQAQLKYYFDNTGASGIAYDGTVAKKIDTISREACNLCATTSEVNANHKKIDTLITEGASERPKISVDDTDDYCLWHTSGSTGDPKGVLLSQEVGIHRLTRQGLYPRLRP